MCEGSINAADSVSTNVSSNIILPINALNAASINFDDKKFGYKMSCCVLQTVLLLLILLLIITIICYHYTKHRSKYSDAQKI